MSRTEGNPQASETVDGPAVEQIPFPGDLDCLDGESGDWGLFRLNRSCSARESGELIDTAVSSGAEMVGS